ncbi:hypothetical protein [Pseudalkalibacillus caeni]|uniref:Phosphatidylinositol kinase n=1 Tax=Exobacillus caeni TaxID=2574798 RepID=A0A5R9EWN9_9BACL|nr:hypothetical protein [Pseudalkalibacillus caeni]TLS35467.1 hypothetical protein FCL54_20440 [Pseudalkalibacillus caeni]
MEGYYSTVDPNGDFIEERNKQQVSPIYAQCEKYRNQFIQVETTDGRIYCGMMHSYDQNNLFLAMPMERSQDLSPNDQRLFPFFPFFGGPFFGYPGFGLFGFPFWGIRRFGFPFWW